MNALKVQVERVVRPIQAGFAHKDRMREELLAHLTRLFDDELARCGDRQLATAEAIRRFGDAPQLTRELQASVPRFERFWFFNPAPAIGTTRGLQRRLQRRAGESPLRYMWRINCWAMLIVLVVWVPMTFHTALMVSRRPPRADQVTVSQAVIFPFCFLAILIGAMFAWCLLGEAARRALEARVAATTASQRRRAAWRLVAYALANAAHFGAVAAGMMLLFAWFLPFDFIPRAVFCWITLGAIFVGPPAVLLRGRNQMASERRFENWESLDLDEPQAA
jgi:hypothetical protein